MYCLVQFENGEYRISESRKIKRSVEDIFIIKYRGGSYEAKLILKSDDKNFLHEHLKSLLNSSFTTSADMSHLKLSSESKSSPKPHPSSPTKHDLPADIPITSKNVELYSITAINEPSQEQILTVKPSLLSEDISPFKNATSSANNNVSSVNLTLKPINKYNCHSPLVDETVEIYPSHQTSSVITKDIFETLNSSAIFNHLKPQHSASPINTKQSNLLFPISATFTNFAATSPTMNIESNVAPKKSPKLKDMHKLISELQPSVSKLISPEKNLDLSDASITVTSQEPVESLSLNSSSTLSNSYDLIEKSNEELFRVHSRVKKLSSSSDNASQSHQAIQSNVSPLFSEPGTTNGNLNSSSIESILTYPRAKIINQEMGKIHAKDGTKEIHSNCSGNSSLNDSGSSSKSTNTVSYVSISDDNSSLITSPIVSPLNQHEVSKHKQEFTQTHISHFINSIQLESASKYNIYSSSEIDCISKNIHNSIESKANFEVDCPSKDIIESSKRTEISELDCRSENFLYSTKNCAISELDCPPKNILNSTEGTDISTNNCTISEYFPNSTINMTGENVNTTNNNSTEKESSVNLIADPVKLSTIKVPHRSNISKKHFCLFCKTLQTKLSRHFFLKHKSEVQVKNASNLPIKSKERLLIIENLRKEGDFIHNTSNEYNSGILIVSRQQQTNRKNTADDYICCKKCKGFFAKNALRNHLSRCGKENKNSRDNFISSRRITQYIHMEANMTVRNKIFPVLRDDDITRSIRYDHLVIVYANYLTLKHTLPHQDDMIRSRLRLLGRFLTTVQQFDTSIKELKDIFKPNLFDVCVKALRIVAKWDDNLRWFSTPAVAQDLSSLIKKVGKRFGTELIKVPNTEEKKINLKNFMTLWEGDIPVLINKKALHDQCTQKRAKKVILPSKDDIKKLYLYLKNNMIKAIAELEKEFNTSDWVDLVKSSLILIQIFNRRRSGEIERLTINNYLNKQAITENVDSDFLGKMSKESLSFSKQFVRLTLRGKLGRTVSVLLSPVCIKAIEIILKNRALAGISEKNEFIFAKKVTSKFSKPYYRACPLLRQFSEECGAKIPQSLRGIFLRKHIATYTSLLNIEEATIDRLANFMGHHKDIHKNIYRVPVPVTEITCISKLLMSAIGDDDHDDDEDDEEEEGDFLEQENEPAVNTETNSSSKKKKRSTSPYGKTKRTKWSKEEKEAVYETFGDLKALQKLPSMRQCLDVINNYESLKNRTPAQLKTWIDNKRRDKSNMQIQT